MLSRTWYNGVFCIAAGVEQLESGACAAVQRAFSGSEGNRLVAPSAWPASVRRRHGRPLPALLEHAHRTGAAEHRHRLTGLQPGLVQTCQRAGERTKNSVLCIRVLRRESFTVLHTRWVFCRSAHTATRKTRFWSGNTRHSRKWPS